jgi:hypothetical protein
VGIARYAIAIKVHCRTHGKWSEVARKREVHPAVHCDVQPVAKSVVGTDTSGFAAGLMQVFVYKDGRPVDLPFELPINAQVNGKAGMSRTCRVLGLLDEVQLRKRRLDHGRRAKALSRLLKNRVRSRLSLASPCLEMGPTSGRSLRANVVDSVRSSSIAPVITESNLLLN